jgi:fructose-bisphosphate aldolase class II
LSGIRDYVDHNHDYLTTQIGNPEGPEVPNKKKYDPRVWLRQGESYFNARLKQAFEDLNCVNRNA